MNDPIPGRLRAALADRYGIERQLGEGGMARVYLAEDRKHQRKVVLKVLRPELAATVGAERFLAEIRITANLQHPHILPLFDSEANAYSIDLSPDDRWLTYVSEVSGRPEVYVRPFPGPGPRVQVSDNGGVEPRWAHSGKEIFYRSLGPDGTSQPPFTSSPPGCSRTPHSVSSPENVWPPTITSADCVTSASTTWRRTTRGSSWRSRTPRMWARARWSTPEVGTGATKFKRG